MSGHRDAVEGTNWTDVSKMNLATLPCGHSPLILTTWVAWVEGDDGKQINSKQTTRYFCGECYTHFGKHEPYMMDYIHRRFGVGSK